MRHRPAKGLWSALQNWQRNPHLPPSSWGIFIGGGGVAGLRATWLLCGPRGAVNPETEGLDLDLQG